MRLKLLSAFLGLLMISGIILPLMMVNNTNGHEEIQLVETMQLSDNSNFWYHDGSNMTGFTSPVGGISSVGSIASSGTYIYATDLGSGTGWHGPAMSYSLEEPFKVSELTNVEATIEFDCLSSTNRLGAIEVILHDADENTICIFRVYDSWADDRQLKLPFSWYYLNGSGFGTPSSEPDWVTFSPYYETLSLTDTSTGFLVTLPDIGLFDIPVSTTEELNRIVSYVTIRFLQFESWTYCEEIFLQSINLEWTETDVANSPTYWHDDCSSTEGWYENTTNVEAQIGYIQTGIALLSNGNGLYSDSIPADSAAYHGPQFFKRVANPMMLKDNLDLQVQIEHIGTSNRMGSIGVVLLDQYNNSFYKVGGVDGWYSSTCNAWVAYREDGSQNIEYNTKSGAWTGTLRVWYDSASDSIKGDADGLEFTLASSGSFDSEREVHFVGLVFYNEQSYTYESAIVNDILLTSSLSESSIHTWHHDCSNTSLFEQYLDWPMDWWWETYTVSPGTMISDGSSFSFTDLSQASGDWYGPIFVYNLTDSFTLENFVDFTVDLEVDNTDTSDAGIISVYLCDVNYAPVIRVFCSDSWDWRSYGHNRAEYRFSNGSYVYHGNTDYLTWSSFDGSISIWSESNGDIHAEVPGFGSSLLLESEFVEQDREIQHIVIQAGRIAHYSWMPAKVRDIKYTIDSSTTSTSTTTSTQTTTSTNETTGAQQWESLVFTLAIGSSFVIVIVVVAICFRQRSSSSSIPPVSPTDYQW